MPAVDSSGALRDVSLEVWAARAELPYFEKVGFDPTCNLQGHFRAYFSLDVSDFDFSILDVSA